MTRKIIFGLLWLGLIGYAFGFAPPDRPDTLELIKRLSTAQVEGINPLIVALFNIMGIFPLIYLCVLLFDGRSQRIRAWPFVTASFAVGAFALLPYLALREPNQAFVGKKNIWLNVLDSRWIGVGIAIAATGLVGYGLTQGNWADFAYQWQTSRFIHVMSLDFCLLCILFSTVLEDDMQRRRLGNDRLLYWVVSLIPLLGAAFYLALRPPIAESTASLHASSG
jgi:hypothetical protein